MSEETRRKLVDDWGYIPDELADLTVHMRDELAQSGCRHLHPERATWCVRPKGHGGIHIDDSANKWAPVEQSAQPSPTTEAPETIAICQLFPTNGWRSGHWDLNLGSGVVYTRADVVEKRVAEAEGVGDILGVARVLDRKPGETCLHAARRVVAALKTSVDSEAALLEGVRKAEASEQAALAKVRELEAEVIVVREDLAGKERQREALDRARHNLERELGEARAARDKAIKEKEASNNLRTHLRSMIDEAIEVLGGEP